MERKGLYRDPEACGGWERPEKTQEKPRNPRKRRLTGLVKEKGEKHHEGNTL
jgi:hypothetical protein